MSREMDALDPIRSGLLLAVAVASAACAASSRSDAESKASIDGDATLAQRAEQFCAEAGWPAGLPTRPFTTDGCSAWPDGTIHACCVDHDIEYWCGGTAQMRKESDRRLGECAARREYWLHDFVYLGVRMGGVPWLPTPWRWGYGHEYGTGYTDPRALGVPQSPTDREN